MSRRTVFCVSERTGVTAETLARSVLAQFDKLHGFCFLTVPFTDTVDKADALVRRIDAAAREQGVRPLVFSTLVQAPLRGRILSADALILDCFAPFLQALEGELQRPALPVSGHSHGLEDTGVHDRRMAAVHYALGCDDGAGSSEYAAAEIILIGVSRVGKTPACLYLALTYGVFAANYPLTEDELEGGTLPKVLEAHRAKLCGLTMAPERLQQMRRERRATGRYATAEQVGFELRGAEALFRRYQLPSVDTTARSIEEIASLILAARGMERRVVR